MSAKTIREWLLPKLPVIICGRKEPLSNAEAQGLAFTILESGGILDYHIIPGTDVVVRDLEAAAKTAMKVFRWGDWDGLLPAARAFYLRETTRILEAAGITVPDEVVEAWDHGGIYERTTDRTVEFGRGDTIYIVRAAAGKED